jgi:hypothetical protein
MGFLVSANELESWRENSLRGDCGRFMGKTGGELEEFLRREEEILKGVQRKL